MMVEVDLQIVLLCSSSILLLHLFYSFSTHCQSLFTPPFPLHAFVCSRDDTYLSKAVGSSIFSIGKVMPE